MKFGIFIKIITMTLIRDFEHRVRYHVRRLRTYPTVVLVLAGVIILSTFTASCWLIFYFLGFGWSNSVPSHSLAIIVPFRDRFDELVQFVPHMTAFLTTQKITFQIFVLNQVDDYRFNRASLINAGVSLVKDDFDYIAMHDVDLLPINPELSYAFPADGPMHIAAPDLHPQYHYEKFIGGILLITSKHFEQVNGLPNKYWGWGMEDDAFYARLKDAGMNISRPIGITTGYETFRHIHSALRRKRDMERVGDQSKSNRRKDRQSGLRDLRFDVMDKQKLLIDDKFECTVYNVKLHCDEAMTPWCRIAQPQIDPKTGILLSPSRT